LKYLADLWRSCQEIVAPRVGAWIEISCVTFSQLKTCSSPPAWGRGLKFAVIVVAVSLGGVAPRVGAWIEIPDSPVSVSIQS